MEQLVHKSLRERLDQAGRVHPRLMLTTVILLAVAAIIVLLSSAEGPVVLYQAF